MIKTKKRFSSEKVIVRNTKRINNALLELTFHEKLNISKFWNSKKNMFKNDVQHRFVVICCY